ncbi:MAG: Amino acid/amide transporter ATP-binding protein 2, family [Bradyrhizobium sp.]|jgi:branched-chain amino acid transport system ATP-binding protein|nr:Amino acid/amide transporter ATP-binding protein 2, family [Bradyrhizobium sp.]
MLRLNNVSAGYGAVTALRNIDITVDAGEVVALIGSNGAGKSTTLRAISGVVRPTAGCIEFQGEAITNLSPDQIVERGIVHVPEGRRVFPRLSVQQNLTVGAYSPRARGKENATRQRVFELFPRLYERRRQLAGSLSGGEQQMLAFGRAMMAQPVLLMLDEPSLGLAPIIVEEIAKAIDYFRESGVTVLLVEQNAELALTLATRGYVIEAGLIVLADSSDSLLDNPKVWASYLGEQEWGADIADQSPAPAANT